jgi:hypothetical protein
MFESIYLDNEELVRLLVSSIKTAKRNGNQRRMISEK